MDNQNYYQSQPTPQPTPVNPVMPQPQPIATTTPPAKKSHAGMIKTIVIILLSLVAATFVGLFLWMYIQWDDVKTDVDGQIDKAVASAVYDNTTELEAEFEEREKYPFSIFAGPVDYGELTFEYPKTWSVYISDDATNGGDFRAYLNPGEVNPVSNTTINALRVSILDQLTEKVLETYQRQVEQGKMTVSIRAANGVNNVSLYEGFIPNTSDKVQGIVAVFKLRDKTVVLQTDALLFRDDFTRVLDTVKYNQ